MDLSIIIPIYNSKSTILKCLKSIAEQDTNYSFEVVIVDDGSTDGSVEFLDGFLKRYDWLYLVTQPNMKQAEARNNGLSHISGDYVTFIDADDKIDKNYIQTMLTPFMKDKTLQWMICGIKKEWSKPAIADTVESVSVFERSGSESKLSVIGMFLNKNKEMDSGLWNKIYSTKIINENDLKFKSRNFYEDTLFNLEYYLAINDKKVMTTNEVLYTLSRGTGESTTTTFDKSMDILSDHFLELATNLLNENFGLNKQIKKIINTLNVRLSIHKIHYHFVTDKNWSRQDTSTEVKKNIKLLNVFFFYDLDVKYKLSCIMLITMPGIYRDWYLKKH